MALTSLAAYKTGIGYTGTARDGAYAALIAAVSQAVKDRCRLLLEPADYSVILTPPASDALVLRQTPVRSVTSVWLNTAANGQDAAFTSAFLVDPAAYWLEVGEAGYSRSGILRRTDGRGWGTAGLVSGTGGFGAWAGAGSNLTAYGAGGLTRSVRPAAGSLKITYAAGWAAVPEAVVEAVHLAVSRLYAMRKFGTIPSSASLNGASYGLAGDASKVLGEAPIAELLGPYTDRVI